MTGPTYCPKLTLHSLKGLATCKSVATSVKALNGPNNTASSFSLLSTTENYTRPGFICQFVQSLFLLGQKIEGDLRLEKMAPSRTKVVAAVDRCRTTPSRTGSASSALTVKDSVCQKANVKPVIIDEVGSICFLSFRFSFL